MARGVCALQSSSLNLGICLFSIVYYTKISQYFRGGTGHWGGGGRIPGHPPLNKTLVAWKKLFDHLIRHVQLLFPQKMAELH